MNTTTIKITDREKQYALALSKRLQYKCPRPDKGSVAHCFKALLHERAKKDGVKLDGSSIYFI
jgi:hypothetical protein